MHGLLLGAALEILSQDGLGTGAEHLTFKRVFERVAATSGIRITNGSVIGRIWENQSQFQSAVLSAMATGDLTDQERAVMDATAPVVSTADRTTIEGRRAALREVMRVAAEATLATGTTSRSWATVVGVWALASGSRGTATSDEILGAMRQSYAAVYERGDAATGLLMDFLGLRLRPPLQIRQFTEACNALVEGSALRDRVDAGIRGIELDTGPGGTPQEWTVLGIGMDALTDQFFELDPEWDPGPSG